MRLGDLLPYLSDSIGVMIIKDGEVISTYDGKDSIPLEHNELFVEEKGIHHHNGGLNIYCYE